MSQLSARNRRHRRRKRQKFATEPLTPEAHAALAAKRAELRTRRKSLRQQWAAEDAMMRTTAALEGDRRAALRRAEPVRCAAELTRPRRLVPAITRHLPSI